LPNSRFRRLTVLLACSLLTACAASKAVTDSASKAAHSNSTRSAGRVINLFGNGNTPPPLLRHLTTIQAAHLAALKYSYGPTYRHGHVIGVAVTYDPLCTHVEGASVTETASKVTVTVFGSPSSRKACALPLAGRPWAVKLPHPLGHRAELHGDPKHL
jgi:hypothetical protein